MFPGAEGCANGIESVSCERRGRQDGDMYNEIFLHRDRSRAIDRQHQYSLPSFLPSFLAHMADPPIPSSTNTNNHHPHHRALPPPPQPHLHLHLHPPLHHKRLPSTANGSTVSGTVHCYKKYSPAGRQPTDTARTGPAAGARDLSRWDDFRSGLFFNVAINAGAVVGGRRQ